MSAHAGPGLAAGLALALGFVGVARAEQAAPPPSLVMPLERSCISSPYGPRVLPGKPKAGVFHPGIDLPAPAGAGVRAVADGTVLAIRRRGAGGLFVLIRHAGFDALYAHLGSVSPALAEGKRRVAAGERIGVVGRTGVSYGAHLYFQLQIDGATVDPAPILGVAPCG
jgi:murein DD-endopeptidase MepM/ murein hydrolase activator NlpD